MLFESDFLRSLEKLELVVKKTLNTGLLGQHQSQDLGGGLEFSDYRQYQIGDDYRYIDWNLYSRLGQLFLKQFTEEREIIVYFLIDSSKSMAFGDPSKLDFAKKIAGALGYIALTQLDRVGAGFYSDDIDREIKSGKGKDWVYKYFQFLNSGKAEGETDLNHALSMFSHKYKKPGLVVILSDFMDEKGYQKGLRQLKENNWRVFVIQTLAREEMNPDLEGELYLVDSETEQGKEVVVNQETLSNYQQKLNEFCSNLSSFVGKYGIDYFRVSTEDNFENLIYETLRREGGIR